MLRFRIHGLSVRITFGFAAVICAAVLFGSAAAWKGLLCIVWHESCHLLALYCLHEPIVQVRMTALGVELIRTGLWSPRTAAAVSLAGPLGNLAAGAVLFCTGADPLWARLHLLLGGFHLLPILPLDGGQALAAALSRRFSCTVCQSVLRWLSAVLLLPVGAAGFLLLRQTPPNPTLLILSLYLLLYSLFSEYTQTA